MKSKNMGTALRLRDGRSLPIEFIARLESGSHPNSTEAHGAERRREIEFAHLSDGTLVDLLCDRSGELIFAVLQNGMITVRHTVKDAGISFITPEVHSSLTRAVRFPTAIGANHAARQLLLEIEEVLERYFDCDPSHRNLLAHFALYSWLSDLFAVAPHIWVVGPYCSGKTTLLRIMSAICRRSILVGDASTPALYAINEAFRPTVLIDEFELGKDSKSRDFLRMLRAGSTMDQRVFRALRVYSLFGPKIIASRVGPGDAALASRGFYVVARASSRPVSVLTPSVLESIAQQLQPKLAAFRLYNYAHLKSVSASLPLYAGFSPRVQDMARALALPITDDADLESQLLEIVRVHDQQGGVGRDGSAFLDSQNPRRRCTLLRRFQGRIEHSDAAQSRRNSTLLRFEYGEARIIGQRAEEFGATERPNSRDREGPRHLPRGPPYACIPRHPGHVRSLRTIRLEF